MKITYLNNSNNNKLRFKDLAIGCIFKDCFYGCLYIKISNEKTNKNVICLNNEQLDFINEEDYVIKYTGKIELIIDKSKFTNKKEKNK